MHPRQGRGARGHDDVTLAQTSGEPRFRPDLEGSAASRSCSSSSARPDPRRRGRLHRRRRLLRPFGLPHHRPAGRELERTDGSASAPSTPAAPDASSRPRRSCSRARCSPRGSSCRRSICRGSPTTAWPPACRSPTCASPSTRPTTSRPSTRRRAPFLVAGGRGAVLPPLAAAAPVAARLGGPARDGGRSRSLSWLARSSCAMAMTDTSGPWAYYSLPTRAWQLAAGGLLALAAPSVGWLHAIAAPGGLGGRAVARGRPLPSIR